VSGVCVVEEQGDVIESDCVSAVCVVEEQGDVIESDRLVLPDAEHQPNPEVTVDVVLTEPPCTAGDERSSTVDDAANQGKRHLTELCWFVSVVPRRLFVRFFIHLSVFLSVRLSGIFILLA